MSENKYISVSGHIHFNICTHTHRYIFFLPCSSLTVSPSSFVEPSPTAVGLGCGFFGKSVGHEGGVLMNWISALVKQALERCRALSAM